VLPLADLHVLTVVGADPRYCTAAALLPGHGVVWGATRKNGAWLSRTLPQGDTFFALCHEAGENMDDPAHDFLGIQLKKPWLHRAPWNYHNHKQKLRGGAPQIEHIRG